MTSQPAGLPLPFPVPSKVSWRHKQTGGTSMVSASPLAHPTGSGANTPPQALACARARTAHTYTHSTHTHPAPDHETPQPSPSRRPLPGYIYKALTSK